MKPKAIQKSFLVSFLEFLSLLTILIFQIYLYLVSSGTITVNDDSSVQVLAEEAVPIENLDAQAAREALSKAQQQLASASDEVAKAEAQIAIEVSEAIVAAAGN